MSKERDEEHDDRRFASRFIYVGTKPAVDDDPAFTAHGPVQDTSAAADEQPS
jgi:hypothetical protein